MSATKKILDFQPSTTSSCISRHKKPPGVRKYIQSAAWQPCCLCAHGIPRYVPETELYILNLMLSQGRTLQQPCCFIISKTERESSLCPYFSSPSANIPP